MSYETIVFEKDKNIATITLNRPKAYNALNLKMFEELKRVFAQIEADEDVRVIIITGSGKFFAAGADISEISKIESPSDAHHFLKQADIFQIIEDFDRPVIAAISGLALGGGCELCLACDLRIAAENAVFGQPEIKIGVIPGGGGTQRLPRLIGMTKAKELLFTGETIDAAEAHRLGFVNKVVPLPDLIVEARALAMKIASMPGVALKMTKFAVNGGMSMDLRSALAYEARCFELLFSTKDQKEGTGAFLEKRKPLFRNR